MRVIKTKKKIAVIGYGGQGAWHCTQAIASDVVELMDENRIIVKKAETNNQFLVFDKEHEEYERLLKVAEDRMSNSMMQDFNLWGFTPYTLKDVSESKENFVIFDYDEEIEDRDYMVDISFNRDIFFRFPNSTRLYRLIDYLSYCFEPVDSGSLKYIMDKSDFIPENQIVSGYKYMNPSYFMD